MGPTTKLSLASRRAAAALGIALVAWTAAAPPQTAPPQTAPAAAPANDSYVGEWRGIITQDLGPTVRYFDMEMSLAPSAADSSAYAVSCHVMDGDYHAYMTGEAAVTAAGELVVQEHELVRADSIPGMAWCLKRLDLRKSMEKGVLHLRGRWSGVTYFGDCPPGDMDLIRNVTRT